MIGWNFPYNNYGQITGISEAGIETFKGSPIKSLAREICQNSLDAVKDENKAVIVEFEKINITKECIPDRGRLDDAFIKCSDFWKEQNDKKAKKFFDKAHELINKEYIDVLRISDFNTTGLDGSDKELNSNWSNLVKGSGISDKGGSAGGSFGIGKSAPFACSDFRTVMYSTLDYNGTQAMQGVARLVSFEENEKVTQGIGFYGNKEKNKPLNEMSKLDKNFIRYESGTDIYILGFTKGEEWKKEIIVAILEGFIVSIWKGILNIKVDDIEISKDTLGSIFATYSDIFENTSTQNYYEVLTNSNTQVLKQDFYEMGNIELYVLLKDKFCRRVYMSRKSGMKIFEKGSISSYIQFAGVLILEGEEVNRFFRPMETPQHDKWEEDRHENKREAKAKKKALFKIIKDYVLQMQNANNADEMDAEGVGDYIADEVVFEDINENKNQSISNIINKIEVTKVDIDKIKRASMRSNNTVGNDNIDTLGIKDDNGEGIGEGNLGENTGSDGGKGAQVSFGEFINGNQNMKKKVAVIPSKMKVFSTDKYKQEYIMRFQLKEDFSEIYIKVSLSGEQSGEEANITYAELVDDKIKKLNVHKDIIQVSNALGKKNFKIRFNLDYDICCSTEVSMYGYKI